MANLITLDSVSLAFGLHPLLDQVKLQIESGERVCLIGRNGAGKSSLLKILDGTLLPDKGLVQRASHLKIARLQQELPRTAEQTVHDFVAEGLAEAGALLSAWHTLIQKLAGPHTEADLTQLEKLQHKMDALNAWQFEQRMKTVLEHLALNPDQPLASLSGGWQRRAALARALVTAPDLLLLDEPTNHLDIEAIQWLEEYLLNASMSLVFITHDRALLTRLATRIIELDRGQLTSWPGDYPKFLQHKAELLHAEAQQNALFDKKLAEEERWIRQGIRARRTRNEGRVRALKTMRLERRERREQEGKVNFNLTEASRSGQLVFDAKNVTYAPADKMIVKQFSLRVMRGDRIGLVGPNGVGKSTLLNILLGHITPDEGHVTQGTHLEIAYFDQLHDALDLEKTVADNITQGGDTVELNGQKRHIMSYLRDFLFTPERALTPVKNLSGGERGRLLLARLFGRPSNLLVMDEPTNDLDMETLALLEELLAQYKGTLLLVSHDRVFLDNVVTSVLLFSGHGQIEEHIGGYEDWSQKKEKIINTPSVNDGRPRKNEPANKKLSFNELAELKKLPEKIEQLESELEKQQAWVASTACYKQSPEKIAADTEKLGGLTAEIEKAYARWEALEARTK